MSQRPPSPHPFGRNRPSLTNNYQRPRLFTIDECDTISNGYLLNKITSMETKIQELLENVAYLNKKVALLEKNSN